MHYASVCSGAEAWAPACHEMGYTPVFHAEIEKHASAVLRYQYPHVPNYGDFTQIATPDGPQPAQPVRLLCGGTPCQTFSVAGLREGLDSYKGGLSLEFIKLAKRLGVQWLLWENVPGVLSADGGEAFGSFLGALAECGYGFAYRVLDLQNWGVPQRRKRVFVVAYLGDWRPAAAVLFERESLLGNPAKGAEAGEDVAGTLTGVPYADNKFGEGRLVAEVFNSSGRGWWSDAKIAATFRTRGDASKADTLILADYRLRRLTPLESERAMGWTDEWTQYGINARGKQYELADGPRYRICGNGWGAPVVAWILGRMKTIDNLLLTEQAA